MLERKIVAGDPIAAARAVGLHYVSDADRGIRRTRHGKGFAYALDTRPVRDRDTLARIRALAIPPAWSDVWISSDPNGHIQATGRDARGRKQYRYHRRWRVVRDEAKYHRFVEFCRALPALRRRVPSPTSRSSELCGQKVVATLGSLLEAARRSCASATTSTRARTGRTARRRCATSTRTFTATRSSSRTAARAASSCARA